MQQFLKFILSGKLLFGNGVLSELSVVISGLGGAFGGQGGRTLLDDLPVFENLQDVDIVQDQQRQEGIEVDLAAQFPDKGALAVSRFQNPQGDQVLDAFPDGDPAYAHGPGKLVFRGKFAPRRPGAAKNLIAELPEYLAADALFFDGFEHGYHPRSLPKLSLPKSRLSDILHLITCQEFFNEIRWWELEG